MQRLPIAIEDVLIAWMETIHADVTAIWANQDGHRPSAPFALLDIISGPFTLGTPEEQYTGEDTYTYNVRKWATLNVQVVAPDALVRAAAIANALDLPTRQSVLQAAGIAAHSTQGLRDITTLQETAHEVRATIDIIISWPEPVEDAPGEIRRVRVTGEVDTLAIDETIDIET